MNSQLSHDEDAARHVVDGLNLAYAPANIQFEYQGWTENTNDAWAQTHIEEVHEQARDMFTTLHQGGYDTLNLYYLSDAPEEGVVGVCGLATSDLPKESVKMSGCVVSGSLLYQPRATAAVHEVGHVSFPFLGPFRSAFAVPPSLTNRPSRANLSSR